MKAIILAAGKGKRFGETTDSLPKPLIKIGGLSLIERNIKLLKSCDFTDIIINVSHLSELIIDKLGNGENFESWPLILRSQAIFSLAVINCKSTFFLVRVSTNFFIFNVWFCPIAFFGRI